jgi:hypothetical protein
MQRRKSALEPFLPLTAARRDSIAHLLTGTHHACMTRRVHGRQQFLLVGVGLLVASASDIASAQVQVFIFPGNPLASCVKDGWIPRPKDVEANAARAERGSKHISSWHLPEMT